MDTGTPSDTIEADGGRRTEGRTYDVAIVGGGPAGLAAALHLAWHQRHVVVIDRTTGPLFFTLEQLHNVPGMPALSGAEIQKRLRAQAKEMGAELVRGNVVSVQGGQGDFTLHGAEREVWRARALLLATGVARFHPTVDGDYTPCLAYAGKGTVFYCPDCEAPEVTGKDTLVVGSATPDGAAATALGLTRFTRRLRLLLTAGGTLSAGKAAELAAAGIPVLTGGIRRLLGDKRQLHGVELESGETLTAEAFFVAGSSRGRTDLATQLGLELSADGRSVAARSPRGDTNVPGVWVAGDLLPMTRQVAVAMGTGNIAAVMIDQDFLRGEVRELVGGAASPAAASVSGLSALPLPDGPR